MKKVYIIIGTVLLLTSIPFALGAISDTADKVKSHRDTTLQGIKNLAKEACDWQVEYIKLRIRDEENPDKMIELANHLKTVQNDCLGWVQSEVFTKSAKTSN